MKEGIRMFLFMSAGALGGWFLCEIAMTNGRFFRPSFLLVATVLILVAPKSHKK